MAATPIPALPGYPVRVTFDRDQPINRLWGIPILGMSIRWLVLVPHLIIVSIFGFGVGLSILVAWIPVLFLGRLPGWLSDFYVTTYRYATRVGAWGLLMVGPYPPFSLDAPYPVDVQVTSGDSMNRLWGFPILGFYLRVFLVIPHALVLFVLGIGVALALLVIWIPVLINGRFPQLGYDLFGGYLRLTTRMTLWTLLMPLPYPPITPGE